MPTLTATGDAAKVTADQTACYVALLLLDAPAPVSPPAPATPGGPPVAQPDSDGSAFESLCHLVGAWIGALVQADAAIPLAELWGHPVTEAQLKAVLDSLSGDDPVPIPLQAIPTQRAFSPPSAPYFDGPTLAALNPDAPLTGAAAFTLNGASQTTLSSDTLPKLAARLTGGDVAKLLSASNVAVPLVTAAPLAAPAFAYAKVGGDMLEDLAGRFGVEVESFASGPNLNAATGLFLFDSDQNRFLAAPHLTGASVGALVAEAERSGAFRNASGLLSRFMLHGLRLPTGSVTPNASALFVGGGLGAYAYTVGKWGCTP